MEEKMPLGCDIATKLIGIVIGLAITILVVYFVFPISPDKVYGWWGGIWQGLFIIDNLIISLFKEGWIIIAPHHTNAYMVWWWIVVIWVAIYSIITVINFIKAIRANSK